MRGVGQTTTAIDRVVEPALFVEKQNSQAARCCGSLGLPFNAQRIGNLLLHAFLAVCLALCASYPQTYPHKLWKTRQALFVARNDAGTEPAGLIVPLRIFTMSSAVMGTVAILGQVTIPAESLL